MTSCEFASAKLPSKRNKVDEDVEECEEYAKEKD